MSHSNIKESAQSLVDNMETYENDSLMTSKLSDSEDTIADVLKGSTYLLNGAGSTDYTVSICEEAVDPNSQKIIVELSHPTVEEADPTVIFRPDLSGSTCGQSDSETSSLGSIDLTEFYSILEGPQGIRGLFSAYMDHIYVIRKKGYLLPFEIICLAFTIACCFMGAYYWPMCPADVYIPRYVFFNGAIGTFSACIEIMDSLWKLFILDELSTRGPNGYRRYFCAFGLGWAAIISTLIEMTQFYTMSYSFQRNEENYCNATFYWFVYYKNIAFGVLVSLTAMIYIPSFPFSCYLDDI